jgi:hypothetical protein
MLILALLIVMLNNRYAKRLDTLNTTVKSFIVPAQDSDYKFLNNLYLCFLFLQKSF